MPVLVSAWPLFLALIILESLRFITSRPQIKGALGEWRVKLTLRKLDQRTHHCLHNVLLPVKTGGFAQIDHLVISTMGIFVIETKNYSGAIFGRERDRNWTACYGKRRKERFLNPILQNKGHIRAIEELLNLPPGSCHNLVVLTGTASFKTGPIPGVLTRGLIRYISDYSFEWWDSSTAADHARRLKSACCSRDPHSVAIHLACVRVHTARRLP